MKVGTRGANPGEKLLAVVVLIPTPNQTLGLFAAHWTIFHFIRLLLRNSHTLVVSSQRL